MTDDSADVIESRKGGGGLGGKKDKGMGGLIAMAMMMKGTMMAMGKKSWLIIDWMAADAKILLQVWLQSLH